MKKYDARIYEVEDVVTLQGVIVWERYSSEFAVNRQQQRRCDEQLVTVDACAQRINAAFQSFGSERLELAHLVCSSAQLVLLRDTRWNADFWNALKEVKDA